MTVETVERELWTCNACGDDEITTGDKPKGWETLWAWATRHPRNRPDRPSIVDMPVHTCHDCSSGPMYFIVRRLIEHLTDDKAREFKGERCKHPPGCTLPNKHEGNHKIPHSRAVGKSTTNLKTPSLPVPPPLHGPDDEPGWDVDDNYPGVLSIDDDGEPLEITFDVDGVCSATKNVPDFSGSKFANCLKETGHDGDHHDPSNDMKWEAH